MILSIYLETCHFLATFYVSFTLCFYLLGIKTFCLFVFYSLLTYIYYAPKSGNNSIPMRHGERPYSACRGSVVCFEGAIFVAQGMCQLMLSCASWRSLEAAFLKGLGGVGVILAVSTVKQKPPETLGVSAFLLAYVCQHSFTLNYLGEHDHLTTPSDER